MKKGFIVLISFLLIIFQGWALPIDSAKAHLVALNFFNYKQKQTSSLKMILKESSITAYYVFGGENQFVIVAGDDAAYPILGYSLTSSFGDYPLPPALKSLLSSYTKQIEMIRSLKISATEEIASAWEAWINKKVTSEEKSSVEPLLYCLWDQGRYYNALCPEDPAGPGGRVWAGCVATMMGMTMYYYRYPTQPSGYHSYNSSYGPLAVDFSQRQYNYNEMPYQLLGDNLQVATLLFDCGVSVNMMYGPDGSGAYMEDAANALRTYFGYNSSLYLDYKDNYSESTWINKLKNELNAGHPLPYAGFDPSGGHAFVCDGYDDQNMFHFNWGWSGYYNGFYYINNLNPGYNFSSGQQAIFGVYPSTAYNPYACGSYTMHEKSGSLQAGYPFSSYGNNLSCSWHIQPTDTIVNIKLYPGYFSTEPSNDVLNIYAGGNTSAQLLGTYSGTSIPSEIVVPAQEAYITFQTNGSITDRGFHIDYYCTNPIFCTTNNILTEPEGFITDGSGSYNYNNNTTCRWIIRPDNAKGILLQIITLALEANDKLYIYKYPENNLLQTLTGNISNQTLYFPYSQLSLIFKSDESITYQGFSLKYSATYASLEERNDAYLHAFVQQHRLNLHFYHFSEGDYFLKVFNSAGQLVAQETIHIASDDESFSLPIHVNPGLYFMQIQNKILDIHQKIMIVNE
jgi:hypothetical protein